MSEKEDRTHDCSDVPYELQEDFLTVCRKHGVSFYWLCEVYRQGRGVATAQHTEGPPVRDEASPNIARYSRESAHATFNGGHHDEPTHSAFHHGMDTVFNLIEADAIIRAIKAVKGVKGGVLTDRDRTVLYSLPEDSFVRPMDVGGTDGSHHGGTLTKLSEYGLVERKRWAGHVRRSYRYRRIPLLSQALAHVRVLSGYGCAGVDQPMDAKTLCGKCGPCLAGRFLDTWGLR